jgi:hypothetical protein
VLNCRFFPGGGAGVQCGGEEVNGDLGLGGGVYGREGTAASGRGACGGGEARGLAVGRGGEEGGGRDAAV